MVMGIHKPDGALVWISVNSQPLIAENESSPRAVVTTFHDITAQKLADESLRRLNRELRAISSCNQILMRADDEKTLLKDICRKIADESGHRLVWVGYAETGDAKTLRPVAWAGAEDESLEQIWFAQADTESAQGPCETAVRSGKTAFIQDLAAERRRRGAGRKPRCNAAIAPALPCLSRMIVRTRLGSFVSVPRSPMSSLPTKRDSWKNSLTISLLELPSCVAGSSSRRRRKHCGKMRSGFL